MRRPLRLLPGAAWSTCLLLAGCGGGLQVRTSYDPAAQDLGPLYKTYAWLEPSANQTAVAEAELRDQIRRLADEALAAKGYRLTDSAPDFRIAWHLTGDEPVIAATINTFYGYTWGRWFPGGGVVFGGGYRPEVPPRSLILDVVDGHARELIWRAEVQFNRDDLADPQLREPALREAVQGMLSRFPP